jgi:hypothetical protein
MTSAYQVPTLALFKVRGIFAQSRKYVQGSNYIEIVMKNIFYLAINIVCSNDNFHFTLQSIEITMYRCILLSCIMLCYHRESYYTFKYFINKGGSFFKIIWTRGCYIFGFMVVVG